MRVDIDDSVNVFLMHHGKHTLRNYDQIQRDMAKASMRKRSRSRGSPDPDN